MVTLSDFRGVDYSILEENIKSYRARDMENFINVGGVTRKRPGWEELKKIGVGRVKFMFEFNDGVVRELIYLHAGTMYRAPWDVKTGAYSFSNVTAAYYHLLESKACKAFMMNGNAYIIGCGNYLVYGKCRDGVYRMRPVFDDELTYVPTTTISIDPDDVTDTQRATLDDVNMLTGWRINQMIGESVAGICTWTVDSEKIDYCNIEITVETLEESGNEVIPVTYSIGLSEYTPGLTEIPTSSDLEIKAKDGEQVESAEACGKVFWSTGKIRMDIDCAPQISGRDNIFVKFYVSNSAHKSRIESCTIGETFGVNGNPNRLFLSGNASLPNIDFYSDEDDFSYFSPTSAAALGSDSVPIVGYVKMSDATLMVLKESNSQEPSIYYRSGRYDTEYDSSGNVISMIAVFPHVAGSIGAGTVNGRASANLGGDPLILTSSGVMGAVIPNNVTTNERFLRERSCGISERLKQYSTEQLKSATATVYDGRYYLVIEDECYIADSRFKYSNDRTDGAFTYEWWRWTNIPASCFAVVDGQLWFGTNDGRICRFDGKYTDRSYERTSVAEMTFDGIYTALSGGDASPSRVICSEDIFSTLGEGDVVRFDSEIHALLTHSATYRSGRIYVDEDCIMKFSEGMKVYRGEDASCYLVSDRDLGGMSVAITSLDGSQLPEEGNIVELYEVITEPLCVCEPADNSFMLKKNVSSAPITIYSSANISYEYPTMSILRPKNIVAVWHTPVMDLGTNMAAKTMLSWTVSFRGDLVVGYETRQLMKSQKAKGNTPFSLENFSLEAFSLESDFPTSYTRRCRVRNFNYIGFEFRSDSSKYCVLNNFSVLYKINNSNEGVR